MTSTCVLLYNDTIQKMSCSRATRVIPKVFGLDILDNDIFYNLYISETYTLYEL